MSNLSIQGLPIQTRIGVTEQERSVPQTVTINIWLWSDLSKVEASDNIADTINYDNVINLVFEIAKKERSTIEHLGAEIADAIIKNYSPKSVTVHVQKQIREDGTIANVTIERP